jgi:hypothetical protein
MCRRKQYWSNACPTEDLMLYRLPPGWIPTPIRLRCKPLDSMICYILLKVVELNFHFHPPGSALYVGVHVQNIQWYENDIKFWKSLVKKNFMWPRQRWIICALDCAWLQKTNCLFPLKGRTFCETWNSHGSDDEESSLSIWKFILQIVAEYSKCRVLSSSGWNSMSSTFLGLIDPENEGFMIILNVRKYLPGKYLPNDRAYCPRRLYISITFLNFM